MSDTTHTCEKVIFIHVITKYVCESIIETMHIIIQIPMVEQLSRYPHVMLEARRGRRGGSRNCSPFRSWSPNWTPHCLDNSPIDCFDLRGILARFLSLFYWNFRVETLS